jgi:hypothetical protein
MEKETSAPTPTAKKMSPMPSLAKAQLNFSSFRNDASFKVGRLLKQVCDGRYSAILIYFRLVVSM